MADGARDRLEQPVTRVGRRADRGRWMPLAWAGGLALVAGLAVAGQRLAVAPVAIAQPAREVAIANATPPPWVASRRWAEDTLVRTPPAGGSNRLDRRWIRVFGRPVAPLVR